MQFASCWRQPAALFIWLPGESGQLGSAGLKVPGAPFSASPTPELGVEPSGSGAAGGQVPGRPPPHPGPPLGRMETGRPREVVEPFLSKMLGCKTGVEANVPN